MKIAVLCPFYGVFSRGAESLVRDIVQKLRQKHTVDIYALGSGDGVISIKGVRVDSPLLAGYRSFINAFHLNFIPFISPSDVLMLSFSRSAFNKIRKNHTRYDIIWNNSSFWSDFFCALYRYQTGTPFITTKHGLPFYRLPSLNYGKILGIPLPQPDRLIAFTEGLKKHYLAKEITIIPNCVDVNRFSPSIEFLCLERYGVPVQIEHPIVLSTAALEPIKRIHLLIKAMQTLKKGTLIVLNNGTLKRELIRLGKDCLGDRFIYLGCLHGNDLASAYALCDVFCLPSRFETFSIAVLEALSTNKPVVTQYCETRKQVIGDAGILIKDASDFRLLAKAIETAFNHNYGDVPRKRALEYSLERVSENYELVMIEVVKKNLRISKNLFKKRTS